MKRIYLFWIVLGIAGVSYGQEYKEMMDDPSVNVYDVIKEADSYFKTHSKGKGSGWKQYQRWRYFSESRFFPSGDRSGFEASESIHKQLKSSVSRLKNATAEAGTWKELGPVTPRYDEFDPIHGTGRTEVVWVDPTDSKYIYTASRSGGFWKTTDGGYNWTSGSQGLAVIGCNAFDAFTSNRNIVYMGSSGGTDYWNPYGLGVLKSTDGGESWQTTSLDFTVEANFNVRKIKIHPSDSDIVFVAANKGLYKTTDGFTTFTKVLSGASLDIEFKPGDPDIIYASVSKSIYKSTDGGATFTKLSGVSGEYLTVSEAHDRYLYVSNGTTIYKSTNLGFSFTSSTVPKETWGAFCASDTNPEVLFSGSNTIHMSSNGGTSWTEVGSGYGFFPLNNFSGWDHRYCICVNGTFYSCNDSNLNFSSNKGGSWGQLLKGEIGLRDNYNIASSITEPYHILSGSQDHGTYKYTNGFWQRAMGGDGMMCGFDRDDAEIYFMNYQYGSLQRMDHGVQKGISPDKDGYWVTPFKVDPLISNTIYAAYDTVYKSNNNGNTWTTIGDFGQIGKLTNMELAPSNSDFIYIAYQKRLWVTKIGGGQGQWSEITDGLPNLWINSIEVDPTNENTAYVTMSGYQAGQKVFKTIDAGSTWISISGNLPNIPALSLAADSNPEHSLYLGMDMGIFYTDDHLSDWIPFDKGIPKVTARDLEIVPSIGKIRAGTWGRGLWESDLYGAESKAPIALFTVENQNILTGTTVLFSDRSTGTPSSWEWTFNGGNPSASTSPNPSITFPEVGEYDVSLTVSNANGGDTKNISGYIKVTVPTYCPSQGSAGTGSDYIKNVTFSNLNNSSGQTAYSDFTGLTATVKRDSTYSLTVSLGWSWDPDRIYAWADWNNDLEFDDSELILSGDPNSNHHLSGQVKIPLDAILGTTRMRIRSQYNATAHASSCGDQHYGEVEDYTLIINQETASSIDKITNKERFTVYPNPASSFLHVIAKSDKKFSVEILDLYGRNIFTRAYKSSALAVIDIPLNNIKNGLYLIRISEGDITTIEKIYIYK